jgi:hypothetical protein
MALQTVSPGVSPTPVTKAGNPPFAPPREMQLPRRFTSDKNFSVLVIVNRCERAESLRLLRDESGYRPLTGGWVCWLRLLGGVSSFIGGTQ